jgi:hypothetical protein
MKKYNLLSIILLGSLFVSCNGSKSATEKYFSFDESKFKSEYSNDGENANCNPQKGKNGTCEVGF